MPGASRTVEVRLIGDASQYAGSMRQATAATEKFASSAKLAGAEAGAGMGVSVRNAAGGVAALGVGAAVAETKVGLLSRAGGYLGGIMNTAVGTFVGFAAASAVVGRVSAAVKDLTNEVKGFDAGMRQVQSITHLSDSAIKALGSSVLDLSTQVPTGLTDLTAGLGQIERAGFRGKAAMDILGASSRAAVAGFADTGLATNAVVGVLKAYNLPASQATAVTDTLTAATHHANISFTELATGLGAFVPLASSLNIPLGTVAAAIDTVVNHGVAGSAAVTGLRMTIATLTKPGKDLADQFRQWGVSSGEAAIKTFGLQGVFQRLTTAAGGSAAEMRKFFPSARSIQVALALTAQGGKAFEQAMKDVGSSSRTAGATMRAFSDQSKSVGFQLDLVGNQITAGVVKATQALTPIVAQGLSGTIGVLQGLGDTAAQVAKNLMPTWHALGQVFENLGTIIGVAARQLAPFVQAFATVAIAGFVVALNGVSTALATVTGFLASNKGIVEALAIAYGAHLAVEVGLATAAWVAYIAVGVAEWFAGALAAAGGVITAMGGVARAVVGASVAETEATASSAALAGGLGTVGAEAAADAAAMEAFGATLTGVGAEEAIVATESIGLSGALATLGASLGPLAFLFDPITIGLAAVAAQIYAVKNANDHANASGKTFAANLIQGDNLKTLAGTQRGIDQTNAALTRAMQQKKSYESGFGGQWNAAARQYYEDINPFASNTGANNEGRIKALAAQSDALNLRIRTLAGNAQKVVDVLYPSLSRRPFLTNDNVQVVANYDKNVMRAQRNVLAFADTMGVDLNQKGQKGHDAVEKVKAALLRTAAAAGVSKAAVASMSAAQIQQLPSVAKAAQKYVDDVGKSFQKATDIISGIGNDPKKANVSGITKFYTDTVKQTDDFLTNIKKAYQAGYDPTLISRLLVAGPQAAGPILDTLVKNAGGKFELLVNQSEAQLTRLQQFATETARLTNVATAPGQTSATTRQLPQAIQISRTVFDDPTATVQSVAKKLMLTPALVAQIAASYQITLPDIHVKVLADTVAARKDFGTITAAIGRIPPEKTVIAKIGDPQSVKTWWAGLKTELEKIPGLRETVAKINDPQQALQWWLLLKAHQEQVHPVVGMTAALNDQATAGLNRIQGLMATIRANPTATVTVNSVVGTSNLNPLAGFAGKHKNIFGQWVSNANGGIVQFASGGLAENHTARIVPPGTVRIFNEPETGGEAYIPMGLGKRPAALPVLGEVAKRFGLALAPAGGRYASGGMWSGHPGMGAGSGPVASPSVTIHSVIKIEGNVYGDEHLRGTMDRMLTRRDESLRRRYAQKQG